MIEYYLQTSEVKECPLSLVSPVLKVTKMKAKRCETCDDNQLREDKEDICKEVQARQIGQAGGDKGEKRDGDNEERAEVHPHLPLHGVLLLEDVLPRVPPVTNRNGLAWLFITALADQTCCHSHHKHW